MNQLNAIGGNHAYHRRSGHKRVDPLAIRIDQSEQTCAFRQSREQACVVVLQSSAKRSVSHTSEYEQECQCDNLAWIERGLRMFLGIRDLVVYTAKQFYDKMFGSHGILLFAFGLDTYSIGESRAFAS
jgi:hypothetical protein